LPEDYLRYFNEAIKEYTEKPQKIQPITISYEKLKKMEETNSEQASALSHQSEIAIDAMQKENKEILIKVLEETQKLKIQIENMQQSLYIDELTKVKNRKWLIDKFLSNNGEKFDQDGVLAVIDLNEFKKINDNFGHNVGDIALRFLAENLLKTGYQIVRYGGDEFFVIDSKTKDEKRMEKILIDLKKKLNNRRIKLKNTEISFKVLFSFGIQAFDKNDEYVSITNKADQKMYKQKRGKND